MASGILVLCEHADGRYKKTAFELLGKARQLVGELGGEVSALVLGDGPNPAELGAWGASRAYRVSGSGLDVGATGPVTRALAAAVEASGAAVVLAPASAVGKDVLPRLAARLGAGMASEVTDLLVDGGRLVAVRPVYAGKAMARVGFRGEVALATVRPNSFGVGEAADGVAEVVDLDAGISESDIDAEVVEVVRSDAKVVDLTEAERIVSGGRSLKSAENFQKIIVPLAEVLGATPGASRAAVDAGYAPHSWQVGQTGKVVNPELYIACGISGAIQHLAGMRTSKVIVAINKDPDAPIFQHATYGLVDDLFEVCPILTRVLAEELQG